MRNPVWPEALDAADSGLVLRKLLIRWAEIKSPQANYAAQQFAALVRKKPFPEATATLARLAKDKKVDVIYVRMLAVEALGKVGGTEAKAILTDLIADTTNVFGQGEDEHRLGDAALAALISMSGKRFADYGLENNTSIGFSTGDDEEGFSLRLYGFHTADARTKAIQKWKDETAKKTEPKKKNK